jgi:uncharacterized SAM-binding protein YcdF (DUF218 family)
MNVDTARRERRRDLLIRWVAIAVAAVVGFGLAGVPIYVLPPQQAPQRADVIMVIGPVAPWRMRLAQSLLAQDIADALLVSAPASAFEDIPECAGMDGVDVTCAQPDPLTTRGEARLLRAEMDEHGWTTAIVITATPHVARTSAVMGRCVPSGVQVIGRADGLGPYEWARAYVYQTAAFVKVALESGC